MKKLRNIDQKEINSWLDVNSNDQVQATEDALNSFAKSNAILPSQEIKNKILLKLASLNKTRREQGTIDINNPPLLTENSNLQDWLLATQHMQPPEKFDNIHMVQIKQNEQVEMFVGWVSEMVPEEVHDDILESFMILEGSCTCHITDPKGETRIVICKPAILLR